MRERDTRHTGRTSQPDDKLARLLITTGVVLLLVPLFLLVITLRRNISGLDAALLSMQTTATKEAEPNAQLTNLQATAAAARSALDEVASVGQRLTSEHVSWDAVLGAVDGYDRSRVSLESLTHEGRSLVLSGRALDESAAMSYVRALSANPAFQQVIVRSMKASDVPFVPAPMPTLASMAPPSTPVLPTPAPSQAGDHYEVDDVQPGAIEIGQAQRHTFSPAYDVDLVSFAGLAGKRYCISTFNLVSGVDTFITLQIDGIVYSNDDAGPLETRSELVLEEPLLHDQTIVVVITNRGAYGSDKAYQVLVEDVAARAFPAPTVLLLGKPSSAPAPATPAGSAMRWPEATPSPAPLTSKALTLPLADSLDDAVGQDGPTLSSGVRISPPVLAELQMATASPGAALDDIAQQPLVFVGDRGAAATPEPLSAQRKTTPTPTRDAQAPIARSVEFILALDLEAAK